MKKAIAIVFSDLHLSIYNQFNENNKRLVNHLDVLTRIKQESIKNECPAFFCGDLFHTPEVLTNELLDITTTHFRELNKKPLWNLFAISGNHDLQCISSFGTPSPSYIYSLSKSYKFLNCIDFRTVSFKVHGVPYDVTGVPYIDHNLGLTEYLKNIEIDKNRKHLLMLHSDFPNAKDTDGRVIGSSENLNLNVLSRFSLTLMGHIHQPQRLLKSVYMIGAPLQQRRTDKDSELGYWRIEKDFSMNFVELSDEYPKFIDVTSEDGVVDQHNYYTIIKPQRKSNKTVNTIHRGMSKRTIIRQYLRLNGIKDKNKRKLLYTLLDD
jgi:DNA repair exonuclease SbcCD nuclease subunit